MTAEPLPSQDSAIRVMIVDDSSAARSFISKQLDGDARFHIVGIAENGKEALEKAPGLSPDVILLDIAMPEMDGLTALPSLLPRVPNAKILILSGVTNRYAELGMQALHLGASDVLEKPTATDADGIQNFARELRYKIKVLGGKSKSSEVVKPAEAPPKQETPVATIPPRVAKQYPNILAIASSTGGPQALLELFAHLHDTSLRVPVLITQHMPATFTPIFAKNLEKASGIPCHEATHEQAVMSGNIYVAPGDYHMTVEKRLHERVIMLNQDPPENFCRPAADPMLRSIVDVYQGSVLLCVLTGMGEDGLKGATKVADAGGQILVQERESCAVWGMPKAVSEAGISTATMSLVDMANYIREVCN